MRKGNVFTSVCQEFCPQEGSVQPPWADPLGRYSLWADALGKHPLSRHPPWTDTLQADTSPPPRQTQSLAEGTHPTGMHFFLAEISENSIDTLIKQKTWI